MAKPPGTIRRRGNGWQVVIRHNGRRLQFGPRKEPFLGADVSRAQVEEWTWRKHAEITTAAKESAERELAGRPQSMTFSEAVERFRDEELPTLAPGTRRAYDESLRPALTYFVDHLGDPLLEQVHKRHIKGYLTWRRVNRLDGDAPLSNRSLNKDRAVLHRLFKTAADGWEVRDGNPVAKVAALKADKHEPVILDDEQYERLLAECAAGGPMLGLYTLVLGETGARAYSEALRLRWEHVDLEGGFLRFSSGKGKARLKGGKGRWTPMTRRLHDAMREHFAHYRFAVYRSPWVFHHLTAKRNHYEAGDRIRDFRNAFDRAAKRAGLPKGFRRHDLRHRRVTTWLEDGADVVLVKEAVGHADLRTTMGYTHLVRESLRSLVRDDEDGDARNADSA